MFFEFLQANNLELVDEIINAKGKDNLNRPSTESYAQILRNQGAEWIIILRDQEHEPCITSVKTQTIYADDIKVFVAVRMLETWFLADSETLSTLFRSDFFFHYPEQDLNPAETLKSLYIQHRGRGIDDKKKFTNLMLGKGFSIERAAAHPNCPSAHYFLTKLQTLASAN
ncbi:hypothetical protein [Spirosoma agri]